MSWSGLVLGWSGLVWAGAGLVVGWCWAGGGAGALSLVWCQLTAVRHGPGPTEDQTHGELNINH